MSMSFEGVAEQPIADPAADDERAAAGVADGARDLASLIERRGGSIGHARQDCGCQRLAAPSLDEPIAEPRRDRVEDGRAARDSVRKHLGHRPIDRAGDRVGDRPRVLPRAVGAGRKSRFLVITSKNSVRVEIGKTIVDVDPRAAQLGAEHSARPTWANFVAAYAPMNGTPRLPTMEDTMIRWPLRLPPEDRQRGASGEVGAHVVHVEELLHLRRLRSGRWRRRCRSPALQTITSRRPNRSTAAATSASMSCARVTSAAHGDRLAAGALDLCSDLGEPVHAAGADGERRAIAGQPHGRRAPDAGRRAGDRDDALNRHAGEDSTRLRRMAHGSAISPLAVAEGCRTSTRSRAVRDRAWRRSVAAARASRSRLRRLNFSTGVRFGQLPARRFVTARHAAQEHPVFVKLQQLSWPCMPQNQLTDSIRATAVASPSAVSVRSLSRRRHLLGKLGLHDSAPFADRGHETSLCLIRRLRLG